VRWLETSLEQFMRAHHAATKAVTLKLPHGELKLRPRTASIVVDDGDAFVKWAEANKLTLTLTRLPDPPARKPDAVRLKQVTVIDKPLEVPEGTPTFILGAGATDEHHEGKLLHPVMLGDEVVPGVRIALAPDERVFGASLAD
jgi:predicted alpha/beta-hydrolase family hydrolase